MGKNILSLDHNEGAGIVCSSLGYTAIVGVAGMEEVVNTVGGGVKLGILLWTRTRSCLAGSSIIGTGRGLSVAEDSTVLDNRDGVLWEFLS